MREKSDENKIREGRGVITGTSYAAWRRVSEAKSTGTSVMLYDPIAKRSVSLLSQGEKRVYWMLRTSSKVADIYEQFPMDKNEIASICRQYKIPVYKNVLSTDFLVHMTDDTYRAISVKQNRKIFADKGSPSYVRLINRQGVEKTYWESHCIPWQIVYSEDIDPVRVANIEAVMLFWDSTYVNNRTSMLKHLIAHGVIWVPMDKPIAFAAMADELKEVDRLYADYTSQRQAVSQ